MKKVLIPALLALLAACTQVEPEAYKVLTLTASGTTDTKTAYAGEKTFSWNVGDKISVICNDGTSNCWQTFTALSAGATSKFQALVPQGVSIGPLGYDRKVAMYPADEGHVYSGTWNLSYHIPAERDFRTSAGGHAESAIPMFAWGSDDGTYTFSNLTGAAKFTFTGVPCSEVVFTFTAPSVKLTGTFGLLYDSIDPADASNVKWNADNAASDSEKTVTYYGTVTDTEVSFYLPYASGSIWGYSTLELRDASSGEVLYSNSHVGNISVEKNRIAVLPALSVGKSISLSFTESEGEVANPERGMMSYSSFKFTGGSIPSVKNIPLDYTGESLAFILFYMPDYMNKDLDDAALNFISAELGKVRTAKKKAVVRFAYEETHEANVQHEARPDQLLAHIDQVADILSANADIIYVVQAGWLGTYGEWYYKTNNHGESVPGYDDYYLWTVSGSKVTDLNNNHTELLDKVLAVVPEPIHVGLRTAFYKRYYLSPNSINSWTPIGSWGTGANERLAFYNDGIRGSENDVGTFKSDTDRKMWYSQGARLACGGEVSYRSESTYNALPDSLKDCDRSIAEMRRQHFSYLHYSTSNRFMAKWIGEGRLEDLKKALGYRLVLGSAEFGYSSLTAGSQMSYSISISNTGCAPVLYPRPFKLVLLHSSGSAEELADLGEVRDIAPGGAFTTLSGSFSLPANVVTGDRLAIWLPDNAESLRGTAAYSIRLANSEITWSSGYNVLYKF